MNADAIVAEALERIAGKVEASSQTAQGEPVEEIERAAGRIHASFIVVGSHGRTGIGRALIGSVAEAVLRRAPIPVMEVPAVHRAAALI